MVGASATAEGADPIGWCEQAALSIAAHANDAMKARRSELDVSSRRPLSWPL
jgi:hypothetical protein